MERWFLRDPFIPTSRFFTSSAHDTSLLSQHVTLPVRTYTKDGSSTAEASTGIIFTHGLGARNPGKKDFSNDEWMPILLEGAFGLQHDLPVVGYTARGHGKSHGWESTAVAVPEQFQWVNLVDDMYTVTQHLHWSHFIVGGSSMGSATSLYTAIKHPDQVKAVIMLRPPTAWTVRAERRQTLLNSARRLQEQLESKAAKTGNDHYPPYHLVLQGTAWSDLPPVEDADVYQRVQCPVLLLTIEGDDAHPVHTATTLHSLLPHSELHVAANEEAAKEAWPAVIAEFLAKVIAQ